MSETIHPMPAYLVLKFFHVFSANHRRRLFRHLCRHHGDRRRAANALSVCASHRPTLGAHFHRLSPFLALVATGFRLLGWAGGLRWTDLWVLASLVITFAALGLSHALARPNLKRMIALSEKNTSASESAPLMARAVAKSAWSCRCARSRSSRWMIFQADLKITGSRRLASLRSCR